MRGRFHCRYFSLASMIFLIEVVIATGLNHIGLVRGSVGDVLATLWVFFSVRSFWEVAAKPLAVWVFVFAALLEIGQAFSLATWLGFARGSVVAVLLGTTFSWADMFCYGLGCVLAYWLNQRADRWFNPMRQGV